MKSIIVKYNGIQTFKERSEIKQMLEKLYELDQRNLFTSTSTKVGQVNIRVEVSPIISLTSRETTRLKS